MDKRALPSRVGPESLDIKPDPVGFGSELLGVRPRAQLFALLELPSIPQTGIRAAARLSSPITLLSGLNLSHSFSLH